MAEKKRSAKLFVCGAVPGFEFVAKTAGVQTYSSLPGCRPLNDHELQLLETLEQTNKFIEEFKSTFPHWLDERRDVIKSIRELADNITWHHRNISIAQIPTSIVGIGGGILTITGLALIPVTFGASLGLTIAGAVVGGAATAVGVATAGTDVGIAISRSKKAKALVEGHKASTENMVRILDGLIGSSVAVDRLVTPEALNLLEQTCIRNGGQLTTYVATTMKNTTILGIAAIQTIPKAAKSLVLLRKGLPIAATAGASTFRSFEMAAADSAGGAVRVAATTGGKVLTGFGFAFSSIGIAVDLVSIAVAAYDLAKGSETSVAKQLREVASQLEKEIEQMKKIKSKLDECNAE